MSPWHEIGTRAFGDMVGWRREHPKATFAEIEAAVETRLDLVRAEVIQQEIALRAEAEAIGEAERPTCTTCGKLMESRGTKERSVTVQGNRPVRLRRRYMVCPACGVGLFPPGSGA
ncbi:MAG: hypothetical protein ACREA0_13045 [bacterium]